MVFGCFPGGGVRVLVVMCRGVVLIAVGVGVVDAKVLGIFGVVLVRVVVVVLVVLKTLGVRVVVVQVVVAWYSSGFGRHRRRCCGRCVMKLVVKVVIVKVVVGVWG